MGVTHTTEMDESGRVTIPKPVREALDVDGERATVQLDVEVVGDDD